MAVYEPADFTDGKLETPYGPLYRPLSDGKQLLVALAAFVGSIGMGHVVGLVPGDLSEAASVVLHLGYILVFFVGYATWVAKLSAIAFDGIGRSVFKALWNLIVHRRKPKQVEDVLPTRDKLLQMAVRAQQAGGSFWRASWSIAVLFALFALMFDSAMSGTHLALLVFVTVLAWGFLLGRLGGRGWLPFPEEE
jgi:hypothetical protein